MKRFSNGAGTVSGYHLRSYRENGAHIVAVADVDLDRARSRAEEYWCIAYADYRDLLEQEESDAVSVCTSPVSHKIGRESTDRSRSQ